MKIRAWHLLAPVLCLTQAACGAGEGWSDWALNEECVAYDECDTYAPFVDAGKAVFHVEYVDDIADGQALADEVCGRSDLEGFSTLIKEWDLESWRIACDGS